MKKKIAHKFVPRFYSTFSNKKATLLLPAFLMLGLYVSHISTLNAQRENMCGTMENLEILKAMDPTLENHMERDELTLQEGIKNMKEPDPATNMVVTIPVVVHVLWNTASENISDAQVISQIVATNKDFSLTNSDANKIPAPWKSIAANIGVQFCLASIDPQGNPTTGIVHKYSTNYVFNKTNASAKTNATGGDDAWDTYKYFNLWVCDLGGTLLGYSEFSGSAKSNTFGSVIHYQVFGTTGNVWSSYNKGRGTTHEVGHCWNLRHIWGDDGTSCAGTDYCADTPNQAGLCNQAYPVFPELDACATSSPGYMFCNYMDYSLDKDKYMFTNDQSWRINQSITQFYPSLKTSASSVCSAGTAVNNISAGAGMVSIYPNPSNGIFNVQVLIAIGMDSGNTSIIEVYNVMGEKIFISTINHQPPTIEIDLSSQPKGMYFLQIQTANKIINKKIVIQ